MWQAFELIHTTFKSGAELYLEDMLPALDNFVQFGAGHLAQKPEYVQALYGMVHEMFQDPKVGGVDRICACKLAEAMMLSLRGHIDQCVTGFITMAMMVLNGPELKVKSYRIHLMEMVINAVYYNPLLTLAVLESKGWTNKFFSLWFGNMDSFSRVHDKKLCIVAIASLLSLNADQVPVSVSQGWPKLLSGITVLFKTLPNALKNREDALKDDFTFDPSTYDYEDEDEWAEDDANWNADDGAGEEEPQDARDGSTAYLEFLNEEAQKFRSLENTYRDDEQSDDELGEDNVLLESPLDKVEPYGLFKGVLMSKSRNFIPFPTRSTMLTSHVELQSENPQFYQSLAQHLSPDEQSVIQSAVNQADVYEQNALQQAAQAAQNPQAGVPAQNGGAS